VGTFDAVTSAGALHVLIQHASPRQPAIIESADGRMPFGQFDQNAACEL